MISSTLWTHSIVEKAMKNFVLLSLLKSIGFLSIAYGMEENQRTLDLSKDKGKPEFSSLADGYGNVPANDNSLDNILKDSGIRVGLDIVRAKKMATENPKRVECGYYIFNENLEVWERVSAEIPPQEQGIKKKLEESLLEELDKTPENKKYAREYKAIFKLSPEIVKNIIVRSGGAVICELFNINKYLWTQKEIKKELLSTGLGKTASKYGNIVLTKSYLVNEYISYVKRLAKVLHQDGSIKVLDIGAATGLNDQVLLTRGVDVFANDFSLKDLATFRGRVDEEERAQLFLNIDPFPDQLNQQEDSFNAVLMSHVAHYLTPSQLKYGLRKIYRWLKPGGKIFFQALTPYSEPYMWRSWLHDTLLKTKSEWPGWYKFWEEEAKFLGLSGTYGSGMPDFAHPIHPKILERELKEAGFTIEYINYAGLEDQKASPLTYEENEKFVKRDPLKDNKSSQKAFLNDVVEKLKGHPGLKISLEHDQKIYENGLKNFQAGKKEGGTYSSTSLDTMDTVFAIAVKGE